MIAVSVKLGMVIVLEKLFEHIVGDLDLLSLSTDFDKFFVKMFAFLSAAVIALSAKPLYKNCPQ